MKFRWSKPGSISKVFIALLLLATHLLADSAPKGAIVDFLVSIAKEDQGPTALYFPSMSRRIDPVVKDIKTADVIMRKFILDEELPKLPTTACTQVGDFYYIATDAFIVYYFVSVSEVRYYAPK